MPDEAILIACLLNIYIILLEKFENLLQLLNKMNQNEKPLFTIPLILWSSSDVT